MTAITRKEYKDFLESILPQMATSEEFSNFVKRFQRAEYSLNNKALLFYQNPEVTLTRGFNQWKQLKRIVKKWEKALYIMWWWAKKIVDEKTKEEKDVVMFSPRAVFDISQTEELPAK